MSTPSALTGIRIVDFSHVYQGPVGTQILADYGADVIKVERPDAGDWSRRWGPFVHGVSLPYAGLNRNKRSFSFNWRHRRLQLGVVLKAERMQNLPAHSHDLLVMLSWKPMRLCNGQREATSLPTEHPSFRLLRILTAIAYHQTLASSFSVRILRLYCLYPPKSMSL